MAQWFQVGLGLGLGLLTAVTLIAIIFGLLDTIGTKFKLWLTFRRREPL